MKTQMNPIVAIVVVVVVLLGVGLLMWQKTAGVAPGAGRRNTFNPEKMEKDPVKIMQGLKALKDKEDAERARH